LSRLIVVAGSLAAIALLALSVGCHLDMLLKSKESPQPLLTVSPA
jgi:hypothetical protein